MQTFDKASAAPEEWKSRGTPDAAPLSSDSDTVNVKIHSILSPSEVQDGPEPESLPKSKPNQSDRVSDEEKMAAVKKVSLYAFSCTQVQSGFMNK